MTARHRQALPKAKARVSGSGGEICDKNNGAPTLKLSSRRSPLVRCCEITRSSVPSSSVCCVARTIGIGIGIGIDMLSARTRVGSMASSIVRSAIIILYEYESTVYSTSKV